MKTLTPLVCALGIFGRVWAADAAVAEKKEAGIVAPAARPIAIDELRLVAMVDGGGQSTLFVSVEGQAAQRVQAVGTKVGKFELVGFDFTKEYADFKSPDGLVHRIWLPKGTTKVGQPNGEREILERLASKFRPSGTVLLNRKLRLIFGRKPIEVGSKFTITDSASGQDYEIELAAIEATTFTLRYHGEEVIRPINRQ